MPTLWDTYQQVGIKEDIDDVITNISPTKTPMQTLIGRDTVDNTLYQWQEDSLRAVAANAQSEGFTATAVQPAATVLRNNRTQILSETVSITGTSDAVAHYGRAKESAYQLTKSMAQVKRDLENALVGTAQAAVVGSSGVARQFAGFQGQLNNSGGATLHVTNGSTNMVVYTGGAGTAPAETTDLMNLLQQLYTNGVDPTLIMVTPTNAVTVAGFVASAGTNRTRFLDNADRTSKTLVNVVEIYVSPFGEQRIVINRFLKSGNTLVFDPDMWKLATLRPWFRETLAKTGDSTQYMIVGEFGLKHKNFAASGAIVQTAGFTGF